MTLVIKEPRPTRIGEIIETLNTEGPNGEPLLDVVVGGITTFNAPDYPELSSKLPWGTTFTVTGNSFPITITSGRHSVSTSDAGLLHAVIGDYDGTFFIYGFQDNGSNTYTTVYSYNLGSYSNNMLSVTSPNGAMGGFFVGGSTTSIFARTNNSFATFTTYTFSPTAFNQVWHGDINDAGQRVCVVTSQALGTHVAYGTTSNMVATTGIAPRDVDSKSKVYVNADNQTEFFVLGKWSIWKSTDSGVSYLKVGDYAESLSTSAARYMTSMDNRGKNIMRVGGADLFNYIEVYLSRDGGLSWEDLSYKPFKTEFPNSTDSTINSTTVCTPLRLEISPDGNTAALWSSAGAVYWIHAIQLSPGAGVGRGGITQVHDRASGSIFFWPGVVTDSGRCYTAYGTISVGAAATVRIDNIGESFPALPSSGELSPYKKIIGG